MSEISNAIKQICDEKGLKYEAVLETIESALAAAYRKDFGEKNQNIKVEFDPESGKSKVYDIKTVVEDMPEEELEEAEGMAESAADTVLGEDGKRQESKKARKQENQAEEKKIGASDEVAAGNVESGEGEPSFAKASEGEEEKRRFNPKTEIQLKDAVLIKKSYKISDIIKTKLPTPAEYGRMAAQTAKQVIIQKLREAERDMVFSEFKDKEHEVIAGVVQRREGRVVLIDLDKTMGILPYEEQIPAENYRPGERIKVYVKSVGLTPKGPEIILSRTSDEILKKVFYLEIPEISNGLVEIKAVAREAGSRAKVAVEAKSENVDPIGSCVGQRGSRIQTIISELGGEKIDIIAYDEDIARFIANALSPAKVIGVEIDEKVKRAVVKVVEDQLSLAIGRDGQNVRLAARLTGWKLDIIGDKPKAEIKKEDEQVKESGPSFAPADVETLADEKASEGKEEKEIVAGSGDEMETKEKEEEKQESKKTKKQKSKSAKGGSASGGKAKKQEAGGGEEIMESPEQKIAEEEIVEVPEQEVKGEKAEEEIKG